MLKVSPEVEALALAKIKEYLEVGVFNKKTTITEKITTTKDIEGVVIETKKERTEISMLDYKGCPDWVIKEIINSLNINTATRFLSSKGYQVVDPRKAAIAGETEFKGLSEAAVNDILSKLLGVTS